MRQAPDLPPEPGKHATFARDHEYKRHGTVSLPAGIDLLTAWLESQPVGRFEFTFTPKQGSWLNLVEGFFSKLARAQAAQG